MKRERWVGMSKRKFAMRCQWISLAIVLLPLAVMAQSVVPAGTILPISLDASLNGAKVQPGQAVRATLMQSIPGTRIHRGARVLGTVLHAKPGGSQLALRFDTIRIHGQTLPIRTSLRALASFLEVEGALIPEEMAIRGTTPETATTEQIGGDQVYRGGGPVTAGLRVVGTPAPNGVLAAPRVSLGEPCRAAVAGNDRPQALWVFSTDACGIYGYAQLRIRHAGRTDPEGVIVLVSDKNKILLRSGTGMLLRVLEPQSAQVRGSSL